MIFLNNFYVIYIFILSKLNKNNSILVIFNDKKTMYCLGNEHEKYILELKNNKDDKYYKLLKIIIKYYENALRYININLRNDKEVVLKVVKQNKIINKLLILIISLYYFTN